MGPTADGSPTPGTDGAGPGATAPRPRRAPVRVILAGALVVAVILLGWRLWQGGDEVVDEPRPRTRSAAGYSSSQATPEGVSALPADAVSVELVATVSFPTALVPRPGSDDLYVAERVGRVRRLVADGAGRRLDGQVVLDVSSQTSTDGERGLLGLAFSDDGDRLYLYRTDLDGRVTIEEATMAGDATDPASLRTVLQVEHPRSNHNGGQLVRGPDGLLYAGIGDGGGGGDPDGNGQDPSTLLGTVLRLDPTPGEGDAAYGIPPGNPFAAGAGGRGGAPEVWAFGLRNPWRFSFDAATGDLWIADVGQNRREEIDWLPATAQGAGRGANLGWSEMEGSEPFEGGTPPPDAIAPLFDYGREAGECSVTGGYVYRGTAIPALDGVYVYADLCRSELRGVLRLGPTGAEIEEGPLGVEVAGGVVSFGQDASGEVYVLGGDGSIRLLSAR